MKSWKHYRGKVLECGDERLDTTWNGNHTIVSGTTYHGLAAHIRDTYGSELEKRNDHKEAGLLGFDIETGAEITLPALSLTLSITYHNKTSILVSVPGWKLQY